MSKGLQIVIRVLEKYFRIGEISKFVKGVNSWSVLPAAELREVLAFI